MCCKCQQQIVIDFDSNAKGRVVGLVIDKKKPCPTVTAHGMAGGNPPKVIVVICDVCKRSK